LTEEKLLWSFANISFYFTAKSWYTRTVWDPKQSSGHGRWCSFGVSWIFWCWRSRGLVYSQFQHADPSDFKQASQFDRYIILGGDPFLILPGFLLPIP